MMKELHVYYILFADFKKSVSVIPKIDAFFASNLQLSKGSKLFGMLFFAPNLHPLHLNFDAFYSIIKYGCIQSQHLRPKSDSIQRNQKKKKSIEKCENCFISIVVGVET